MNILTELTRLEELREKNIQMFRVADLAEKQISKLLKEETAQNRLMFANNMVWAVKDHFEQDRVVIDSFDHMQGYWDSVKEVISIYESLAKKCKQEVENENAR